MGGDTQALRQLLALAEPLGLGHGVGGDVADRDIAALSDELPGQLATHARTASGDDGAFSDEILHGRTPSRWAISPERQYSRPNHMMRLAKLAAAIHRLVINLKAAKTLGLELPPTLLTRADEVIE
jgi:hypothetical protein